ncbi:MULTISPECIES: DUF4192 domain-containing protein [Nocardia]|uniref:DUF4192 domain-containing protein n=1 Tax=Nocardia TaxID=1817 RepID=UPI000D68640E|nr:MULTISPECIES: DUF4192 domain-containing protein [Nocardia]
MTAPDPLFPRAGSAPDPALADMVSAVLPEALAEVFRRRARVQHEDEESGYDGRDLELVLHAIATLADGATFTAPDLARLGAVLSIPAVSQCLPATATGEHAHEAEALWTLLTRVLTGTHRANPAVLLCYSAFLRGETVLAQNALSIALEADPGHVTARLLDAVYEGVLPPTTLPRIARLATAAATDVGITID